MDAASPSRADVLAAIAGTAHGGTINVPAGIATWTSGISLSGKTLTILGAGVGQTVITLTGSSVSGFILGNTPSRISGFDFTISGSADKCIYARGQGWRIDGNAFRASATASGKIAVFCDGTTGGGIPHPSGVIDGNTLVNTKILVHGNADLLASVIWNEASIIGTQLLSDPTVGVVVVEDNDLTRAATSPSQDVMDSNYGGRYIFRNNAVVNGTVECHSVQLNVGRAGKSWEVYDNTFNATGSRFAAIWMRGGTGVVHDNAVTGSYNYAIALDNVRSFTVDPTPPPGTGDGTSNWDKNTVGEEGWPLRDQIGRGPDATLYAGTGATALPDQASEPSYFWSNTFSAAPVNPTVINNTAAVKPGGSSADIVLGRDYFNSARPSYTESPYPHPLVGTPAPPGPDPSNTGAMPAFTHHRDFSDSGFQAHSGVLDGGRCQWDYKNAFWWKPSLLDNATYELEFTINNPNAQDAEVTFARSDSYSVTLVELAPVVTIPAGSGQKTYRTPVTFPVDSHYTQWELYVLVARNAVGEANCEAPTVGGGIKATMARLKIHQAAGWTNTVVTRPMVNGFEGDANCFYCQTDLLDCALNVPCYPLNSGLWERLDTDFEAVTTEYKLQSVIASSASANIFRQGTVTGLWNVSQTASVLSSLDGRFPNKFTDTPQFDFVDKAITSDPKFVNLDLFRWYWYVDDEGDQSKLFGADLYIILTTVSKVTTWARVSKGTGTSTNGFPETKATARVLAADFANASELFIEVSGLTEPGVTGQMELLDSGAVDDGTGGSSIAASVVIVTSQAQAIVRSTTFSTSLLPSTSRLLSKASLASGSGADFRADWHLIGARYEGGAPPVELTCPPSGTIDLVCKTGTIQPICKNGTISCCIPS